MKRIYYATGQRLGYREFSEIQGPDVIELKSRLQALGYWRPDGETIPEAPGFDVDPSLKRDNPEEFQKFVDEYRKKEQAFNDAYATYDGEAMDAVEAFRKAHGLNYKGNPRGLVDRRLVDALDAAYYEKMRAPATAKAP